MSIRKTVSFATLSALVLVVASAVADVAPRPSTDETITFFYYDDLDAAAAFYEELLGLEKTMDEGWVRIFRITPTSSVGLVLNGRGFHAVSEDKPAMLSIVTDDVDAWYRRLGEAGVTLRTELRPAGQEPEEGRAPVRGFVAEDPGGYTVEFFSWQ
jgi:catechol 2,3-dioxygenase-like lactoylglutathione lyase family enzyme